MSFVYRPGHRKANENGMVDSRFVAPKGTPARHYVIGDEMPPTRHMATGEMFTSKAKFRQRTRDVGCVEVGNDRQAMPRERKAIPLDRGARREAIRRSIHELRNR